MKKNLMTPPKGTLMINVSIDDIRTSRKKIDFPKAYPFIVKPGQRMVITTREIYMEKDE